MSWETVKFSLSVDHSFLRMANLVFTQKVQSSRMEFRLILVKIRQDSTVESLDLDEFVQKSQSKSTKIFRWIFYGKKIFSAFEFECAWHRIPQSRRWIPVIRSKFNSFLIFSSQWKNLRFSSEEKFNLSFVTNNQDSENLYKKYFDWNLDPWLSNVFVEPEIKREFLNVSSRNIFVENSFSEFKRLAGTLSLKSAGWTYL